MKEIQIIVMVLLVVVIEVIVGLIVVLAGVTQRKANIKIISMSSVPILKNVNLIGDVPVFAVFLSLEKPLHILYRNKINEL
jgi:hypothetical protein